MTVMRSAAQPRPDGPVGQGVLPGGGLLMVAHLLGRGLADVDEGRPVEVPGPELGRAEWVIHDRPPRRGWPPGASPGAVRAGRGAVAAARSGSRAQTVGGIAVGPMASVRGGGERCVGRWSAMSIPPGGSARCCRHHAASSSSRGDVDGNRRRWPRTTCRLRWGLSGPFSIGVKSGLYGGSGNTLAPARSIASVTAGSRWADRLSNTTTSPSVEGRHEDPLHVRLEGRLVGRAGERQRGADAIQPHGRDHRDRLPRGRGRIDDPLAARGPAVGGRHGRRHPGLVHENKPLWLDRLRPSSGTSGASSGHRDGPARRHVGSSSCG